MTQTGYVLGISSHFHDSAAALVQGDRIVAAAQEERFTRRKGDWSFPENAIRYCLSWLPDGVSPDKVAYFEDPGLKARRMLRFRPRTGTARCALMAAPADHAARTVRGPATPALRRCR